MPSVWRGLPAPAAGWCAVHPPGWLARAKGAQVGGGQAHPVRGEHACPLRPFRRPARVRRRRRHHRDAGRQQAVFRCGRLTERARRRAEPSSEHLATAGRLSGRAGPVRFVCIHGVPWCNEGDPGTNRKADALSTTLSRRTVGEAGHTPGGHVVQRGRHRTTASAFPVYPTSCNVEATGEAAKSRCGRNVTDARPPSACDFRARKETKVPILAVEAPGWQGARSAHSGTIRALSRPERARPPQAAGDLWARRQRSVG